MKIILLYWRQKNRTNPIAGYKVLHVYFEILLDSYIVHFASLHTGLVTNTTIGTMRGQGKWAHRDEDEVVGEMII